MGRKCHYRLHKIPRAVSIPSHFLTCKIHFNIILLSTSWSSKQTLCFRLSKQTFVHISHVSSATFMALTCYPL
jgi:hypothetical protein